MDKRNTITEELRELSPAVANITRKNVYTVPFGYFENFNDELLSIIRQKEQPLPIGGAMPFSVPGGYFETLASKIIDKARQQASPDHLSDDLKEIAPQLLSLRRSNVWSVPDGYFETLADQIVYLINHQQIDDVNKELTEVAPFINTITTKTSFIVPAKYFENLAEEILYRIKHTQNSDVTEELEIIAPLLNRISRKPVFSLPAGYFDNIEIKATASPVTKGKVVLFSRFIKAAKYAAAAVTTGIIITGSILFFDKDGNSPDSDTATIQSANIPEYKPEQLHDLSKQEIKEYLSSYDIPLENIAPTLKAEQDDLDNFLKEMSDQEIKQYLQENAEPSDAHFKEG